MRNIYLIQPGSPFSSSELSFYIPYAAGVIAAQAWQNETVKKSFSLADILFLTEDINAALERVDEPFLAAFSCYVWNFEYNKKFAARIKQKYPRCIIVFGGHHVPPDDVLLSEEPYMDILLHGEGEQVFERLLEVLANGESLESVPNLSLRQPDGSICNTPRVAATGCDYPSPYTQGIFDKMIAEHPEISFSGILETNRGCVNNCAFCDWGPHNVKVRMFPLERVRGDIEWFAQHGINYIWGADANFGKFERDELIAQWLVDAKKKTGCPSRIKVNYAKYDIERVKEITKKFADADMSKGATISLQSACSDTLRSIGRKNMPHEQFADTVSSYRKIGIPTYTELILALPGETYESFTNGIDMILCSGQHSSIEVYDCELLPNSMLASKEYIEAYKIETSRIPYISYHSGIEMMQCPELSNIVVSTSTMSRNDWIKCKMFFIAARVLHCFAASRCTCTLKGPSPMLTFTRAYSSGFA